MACGLPYHDERGDVKDCEPEALCRRCLLGVVREQADALREIWPFVEEDDGGFATPQYQAAIDKVRAALGMGTKK